MKDDRLDFAKMQSQMCKQMGADDRLFRKNLKFLLELEKYKYSYLWNWFGVPIDSNASRYNGNSRSYFQN